MLMADINRGVGAGRIHSGPRSSTIGWDII